MGREFSYGYRSGAADEGCGSLCGAFDYLPARASDAPYLSNLPLPLLGEHQAANAAVAIAAVEEWRRQGWRISEEAIRGGLGSVRLPARAEIVRQKPTVLLDTAHNVASVRALANVLETWPRAQRRHLVFAATLDKDVVGMLEVLLPLFDTVWLTKYQSNPRGVPVEHLMQYVERCGARPGVPSRHCVRHFAAPREAWQAALADACADDLICITGSFFLAAELRHVVCDG